MIRLGLRLTLASGREALVRLIVIALAVTVGAGLLLAVLAGVNAVGAQNARYNWLNSAISTEPAGSGIDPMWWSLTVDYFRGETIGRIDVAALGPHAAVPPGVPRLPGPGEYYASPALAELLRTTPAARLGDRYPGHEIGVIGAAALPSPDSLLILIGRTSAEAAARPFATKATGVLTTPPQNCSNCYVGLQAAAMNLILGVVATALLFPVLMFIGTATRLAATRREQRFAAMRLVGATSRQLSVISGVEAAVAAVVGTALGFGLYAVLHPALARIPFTGLRFFDYDLRLTVVDVLVVALGIPLAAVVAAWLALSRVRVSPLGVSRRVTPRPPSAWRLIPLAAGVAEMVFFLGRRPDTSNGQLLAYLSGIFLIMLGLLVAGPWLTMLGARVLAGRAGRAPTLIAGRRLADNPKVAFRAVSGLMLALFVTSVATGVISTFVTNRANPASDSVAQSAVHVIIWPEDLPAGAPPPTAAAVPSGLAAVPGVRTVMIVYAAPGGDKPGVMPGLTRCAGLPARFGSCPPGAAVGAVQADLEGVESLNQTAATAPVWDAAPYSPASLATLPLLSVVVDTDGSPVAHETAQTMLENAFPQSKRAVGTNNDFQNDTTHSLNRFQQLAAVVIVASLPIAGCSLAVSVAGGITDRRRPFSMLRLTGVRLAELRKVVLLESVVPLLTVAVLAIGMGFLAAQLFLRSQLKYDLVAPSPSYYLLVGLGLVLSIAVITSTMPILRRVTGPETARNE